MPVVTGDATLTASTFDTLTAAARAAAVALAPVGSVQADGADQHRGTVTLSGGTVYVGQLRDHLPHGQGAATYPDGTVSAGEWRNGKRHGQGTVALPDGTVAYAGGLA